MDIFTRKKRSAVMSKIKSKNTGLELQIRKQLFSKGFRYRVNYPITGKPDIVFPGIKTAVFVNGCFWHQHKQCKLSYMPKTNTEFWTNKLTGNVNRDKKINDELRKNGWNVITVWECMIEKKFDKTIYDLIYKIKMSKK